MGPQRIATTIPSCLTLAPGLLFVLSQKSDNADRGGARKLTDLFDLKPTRLKAGMGGQLALSTRKATCCPSQSYLFKGQPSSLHAALLYAAPKRAATAVLSLCNIAD